MQRVTIVHTTIFIDKFTYLHQMKTSTRGLVSLCSCCQDDSIRWMVADHPPRWRERWIHETAPSGRTCALLHSSLGKKKKCEFLQNYWWRWHIHVFNEEHGTIHWIAPMEDPLLTLWKISPWISVTDEFLSLLLFTFCTGLHGPFISLLSLRHHQRLSLVAFIKRQVLACLVTNRLTSLRKKLISV